MIHLLKVGSATGKWMTNVSPKDAWRGSKGRCNLKKVSDTYCGKNINAFLFENGI